MVDKGKFGKPSKSLKIFWKWLESKKKIVTQKYQKLTKTFYEWYNYSMIIMNKIIRLQSTNNVLDAKI